MEAEALQFGSTLLFGALFLAAWGVSLAVGQRWPAVQAIVLILAILLWCAAAFSASALAMHMTKNTSSWVGIGVLVIVVAVGLVGIISIAARNISKKASR
jgi:hypothetical protein